MSQRQAKTTHQRTKRRAAPREALLLTCAPIISQEMLARLADTLAGLLLTDTEGHLQQVVGVRIDAAARKLYGRLQVVTEAAPYVFASLPVSSADGAAQQEGRGQTTVGEAGRKGGRTVKERYGVDFYGEIGKKGGRALKDHYDADYFTAIGKKGGQAVSRTHGPEFFSQIGKKGGNSLKAQRGPVYYRRIGQLGGTAPRRTKRRDEAPPS